jgi:Lhr-like helicase
MAIKNKKSELFTQIELIRPGTFSSKEQLKNATIGLTWSVMQDFYLTKTKEEVLKDLPEKMRSIIDIEVPNCPDIEEGTTIGDLSRLKANVARAKAPSTVDFVKEIIETSDSAILVFTDSVDAAIDIKNALGDDALLHHGQMRDDARESVKQRFQEGEGRVFVSTRQSLAVGATLTRADKVVFNDLPWTPSDIR